MNVPRRPLHGYRRNLACRRLYLALAYVCIGFAAAGVVLPGLPVTPFLLVAAWAAGRSSPRLQRWLYASPHFGPVLRHWREQRAVSRRAKLLAVVLLSVSWVLLLGRSDGLLVPALTGAFFIGMAGYLVSRPSPVVIEKESVRD